MWSFELQAELATFFIEHNLYLKEQLTDKLHLLSLGFSEDIFTKMNKPVCHFKENSQYLLPMITLKLSGRN